MSWHNRSKDSPMPIKRHTEKELLQAISDLIDRGYELCYPPKEVIPQGYSLNSYDSKKKRYIQKESNQDSYWICAMKRKKENNNDN